jgi:hypothetical protein
MSTTMKHRHLQEAAAAASKSSTGEPESEEAKSRSSAAAHWQCVNGPVPLLFPRQPRLQRLTAHCSLLTAARTRAQRRQEVPDSSERT